MYVYLGGVYGLWSVLLWKFAAGETSTIMTTIVAAVHFALYVSHKLILKQSTAEEVLLPGFGQNIREDSESNLTE